MGNKISTDKIKNATTNIVLAISEWGGVYTKNFTLPEITGPARIPGLTLTYSMLTLITLNIF